VKTKFILKGEEHRRGAIEVIRSLELDPVHEVVIREAKKDRSASQLGLYWLWVTCIADHTGETKDDVHRRMKKRHLIPIYMDDPDSGMTETVLAVRDVHSQGMKSVAKVLENKIIDLVSTKDASVKQFTAYLEQIEREHIGLGIQLPHPEDWHLAMGQ